uniref:Uncharacterized protein n=1 Tax=Phocoena sinus TaxID=42100 RepID=A0A8C9BJ59_PHOSS
MSAKKDQEMELEPPATYEGDEKFPGIKSSFISHHIISCKAEHISQVTGSSGRTAMTHMLFEYVKDNKQQFMENHHPS